MNQLGFSDAEYQSKHKQTRREKFFIEMEQVVPWRRLEKLIESHYPKVGLFCNSGTTQAIRLPKMLFMKSPLCGALQSSR